MAEQKSVGSKGCCPRFPGPAALTPRCEISKDSGLCSGSPAACWKMQGVWQGPQRPQVQGKRLTDHISNPPRPVLPSLRKF